MNSDPSAGFQASLLNAGVSTGQPRPGEPQSRFEIALLTAAAGDALGWPNEFAQSEQPISEALRFAAWRKRVGGRWWAYVDDIQAGEYSDDTQLTLAIARSMDDWGSFLPERFAYLELPLWMDYERGGGRAVRLAARALSSGRRTWSHNFYGRAGREYRAAGGNGAAMRTLPLALASFWDEERLLRESLLNTLITHGHPRAFIGTALIAWMVRHVLTERGKQASLVDYLLEALPKIMDAFEKETLLKAWVRETNQASTMEFMEALRRAVGEATDFLTRIEPNLDDEPSHYYREVGALDPQTRGSGLGTACCVVYLAVRFPDEPATALKVATRLAGSDTDTIGSMLGGLLGLMAEPSQVGVELDLVQDAEYIRTVARRLQAVGRTPGIERGKEMEPSSVRALIKTWKTTLSAVLAGQRQEVEHPTIGFGRVLSLKQRPTARPDYVARLARVQFDSGQTCVFRDRVRSNSYPSR